MKEPNQLSWGSLLIALGIIFGDIGTSPLYVVRAFAGGKTPSEELILGGLSCIFWMLTLQTTVKYVLITLKADNHGEGGIFALYALIRRRKKWLFIPAIIGGSTLLADSIITPSISVTSAVEGLETNFARFIHLTNFPAGQLGLLLWFCLRLTLLDTAVEVKGWLYY